MNFRQFDLLNDKATLTMALQFVILVLLFVNGCRARAAQAEFGFADYTALAAHADLPPDPRSVEASAPAAIAPPRPPTLGDQARALRETREPPAARREMAPARAPIAQRFVERDGPDRATMVIVREDGAVERHEARYVASAQPARALERIEDQRLGARARRLAADIDPVADPAQIFERLAHPPNRAPVDPLSAAAGAAAGALAALGGQKLTRKTQKKE